MKYASFLFVYSNLDIICTLMIQMHTVVLKIKKRVYRKKGLKIPEG